VWSCRWIPAIRRTSSPPWERQTSDNLIWSFYMQVNMAQTTSPRDEPLKEPLNDTGKTRSLFSETSHSLLDYKVYTRRWLILFVYVCFAFVNNIQWIQYAIINNLIMRYYNVSSVSVDWTSIIFMATFVPLVFPALFFLEKKVSMPILLITVMICRKLWINDTNLICVTFTGRQQNV
jgi:hypothetical protein